MSNMNKVENSDPATLAARVKQKRESLGWSQQQLADEAGSNQPAIQAIEYGRSLKPRSLGGIAAALNTTEEWLMYGVEQIDAIEQLQLDAKIMEQAIQVFNEAKKELAINVSARTEAIALVLIYQGIKDNNPPGTATISNIIQMNIQ